MKIIYITFVLLGLGLAQQQQRIEWPSLANAPWPVLNGDMQGTGRSEYVGPISSYPHIRWMDDLPLGIFWGPTIGYDDILYFGSFALDFDFENHIYAYYPDGNPYWTVNTSTGVPNVCSALITSDSTIYIAANNDTLYSISSDGNVIWKTSIGFGFRKMHISIDKTGNIYTFNEDTLRVLDKQSNTIFVKEFNDISTPIIFSPDGNMIYFKTGPYTWELDHSLVAADLQGNIIWRKWFFETNDAPVTVDNQGNIYFYATDSTGGIPEDFIYSLDSDGNVRWKYETDGYLYYNSVTIDPEGNVVFYCRKENGDKNYIVSLKNKGEVNWEVPLEPNEDPFFAQVDHGITSDSDGNIYFGSSYEGGYFYAMNKYGEFLWKLSLNGYSYYSSPAIGSDGTLYIGTSLSTFFQSHVKNLIAVNDKPDFIENEDKPLRSFQLYQNYPNPFNPSTSIEYAVQSPGWIKLDVYNPIGAHILNLVNEYRKSGAYTVNFNARGLPSGVYFYSISSGTNIETKKMLLIR